MGDFAVHIGGRHDEPVTTQEMTDWLSACLDRDKTRLLNTAHEATGTPGGSTVIRLAMDQVSNILSQKKIIDIADKALADGGDPRFGQILAWLAYARQAAPGYLDTWAPEEADLVAELEYYDLDEN